MKPLLQDDEAEQSSDEDSDDESTPPTAVMTDSDSVSWAETPLVHMRDELGPAQSLLECSPGQMCHSLGKLSQPLIVFANFTSKFN